MDSGLRTGSLESFVPFQMRSVAAEEGALGLRPDFVSQCKALNVLGLLAFIGLGPRLA